MERSHSEGVRFGEREVVSMGSHCSGSREVRLISLLSRKTLSNVELEEGLLVERLVILEKGNIVSWNTEICILLLLKLNTL